MPGWLDRISGDHWLVCGVAVNAYVTSSATSVMTALSLAHQINSIADLPG
ncbi:extracellular solute-binding domain protein (plasmid) [Ochrobactrum quorumnocens]|uniref:Extracellular solute-binding domain protein n=1 Tax=Ochrobactrum quorumnocens TaxID=271865 RepID=A0A248UNP5_9HYPH|nr:extracellular solute-binding domain protein [[Ochrobactrum] quorumnocens]